MAFPKGFFIGAATAAHQVEGNNIHSDYWLQELLAIKCHMSEDRTLSEKEARLKAALKRISKVADTAYYTEAVKKVRKGFGHKNYYQSTEEVMVALELLRRGYTIYHQVGIASFRVDFLIPELSVVLEVDGEPYHRNDFTSLNRTEMRDYLIEQQLGSNFKVIHIQTKYINRNVTKLVPAIKAIIYKQCS